MVHSIFRCSAPLTHMTGGQSLVSLSPSACCVTQRNPTSAIKPWKPPHHLTAHRHGRVDVLPVVATCSEASLKHILAEFEQAEDVKRTEEE